MQNVVGSIWRATSQTLGKIVVKKINKETVSKNKNIVSEKNILEYLTKEQEEEEEKSENLPKSIVKYIEFRER